MPQKQKVCTFLPGDVNFLVLGVFVFLSLMGMGYCHTPINLRNIFIQNAVFSRSILLSFIDVIKVGISNKP